MRTRMDNEAKEARRLLSERYTGNRGLRCNITLGCDQGRRLELGKWLKKVKRSTGGGGLDGVPVRRWVHGCV